MLLQEGFVFLQAAIPVGAEVHTPAGPNAEGCSPGAVTTFPSSGGSSELRLWFTLAKRLNPPLVSFFLSN